MCVHLTYLSSIAVHKQARKTQQRSREVDHVRAQTVLTMIFIIQSLLKSILVMLFSLLLATYGMVYAIVEDDPITQIKEVIHVE